LFHEKPQYSGLRTFGCACWPNLRPFNTHKLQFRSKQCIFLGYSSMHKGFKCLDVAAGRVYNSRDVVFDESVYHFSKLNPNVSVRLRSEVLLLPNHIQPNNLPTPGVELIDYSNINALVIPVTANATLSSGQIVEISTSNNEATLGVRRPQFCADQIIGADQIAATEGPVTQSCADPIICADQIAATGGPATVLCQSDHLRRSDRSHERSSHTVPRRSDHWPCAGA
jgi:hypothetical protein